MNLTITAAKPAEALKRRTCVRAPTLHVIGERKITKRYRGEFVAAIDLLFTGM